MYKKTSLYVWMALVGCLIINKHAFAAPLLCEAKLLESALPGNAYYLPENQARELPSALNRYNVVRLKPHGDYSRASTIKLRSNQALYSLGATKLPKTIITAGTSNAILSGVSPERISFESGGISKENCINRISNSLVEAKNTTLENNLFTDLSNVKIDIDTSQKGYIKNNRFVRTMVHGGYPAITLIGDPSQQSTDNQFIWTNILTPWGDGIIIKNQRSISFTGLDAESWNWGNKALYPGMMNVFNTGFLSVFMSNGSDVNHNTGQYFNIDADTTLLQGMHIGSSKNPGIIVGEHVKKLIIINGGDIGLQKKSAGSQVIEIFKDDKPVVIENQSPRLTANLDPSAKQALLNTLQVEQDTFRNWDRVEFGDIPDPTGNNWERSRSSQPDSSDAIQQLIDKNGVAELNEGLYYLAKPLKLKHGQGIIGAGANKTALIAKSYDIDLIVGADHADKETVVTSFTLADLTLQGGRNGISHTSQGSGQGADYNQIALSHVTFRNMQNAGILIDNIYAWDNNFIDHTHFYRCKTGIKQRPDPAYAGGNHIGITFLDKNVFYQSQFVENEVAIDWQAKRGNNLNAFVNCLFKNNGQAIDKNNSDSTFFANNQFESADNQSLLRTNRVTGFVDSLFITKQPGHALFDGNVLCNHCNFDNSLASSGLVVSPNSKYSFFINSSLSKPVNQPINTGLILNSNFSGDPRFPIINQLINNQAVEPF